MDQKIQRRKGERKMKRFLMMLLTITMIFGTVTTVNAMTWREWIKSAPKIEFAKNVRTRISIGWEDKKDVEMWHVQVSKENYFKTHCDWHLDKKQTMLSAGSIDSSGYITGLKNDPKYYVRVRAKIDGKYRRWSQIKKVENIKIDVDTDQDYGDLVDNLYK